MKRLLFLLMPYGGHFYPNLPFLRLAAEKGASVLVFCDEKYRQLLPQKEISIENYPEPIRSYCAQLGTSLTNPTEAAREYFSYLTEGETMALRLQKQLEMSRLLAELLGSRIREYQPDAVFFDAQAGFTATLLEELSCPRFELNASVFLPKPWQSECFRDFYQEILRPSYPGDITFDQVLGLQRKAARWEKFSRQLSFGYLSPSLQVEPEKISAPHRYVGFSMQAVPQQIRDGIYISRGTVSEGHGAYLLLNTVKALEKLTVPATVTCGGNSFAASLLEKENFPAHIRICSYTNQPALLAQSKVFVTHGGITGVREALLSGTPMLIIPANFPDYLTGRAIEHGHAGILIRRRPLDAEELCLKCMELLKNFDEYQAGTIRMAEELKSLWEEAGPEEIWKECELSS